MRASPSHTQSCAWTSLDETSRVTFAYCCARKATTSTRLLSSRSFVPSKRYGPGVNWILYMISLFTLSNQLFPILQRACYLSLNPQKDETLETEKAQYVLPDGSTLNVSPRVFKVFWTDAKYFLCLFSLLTRTVSSFSDRSGQIPRSRASVQTWPDRGWKLGDPRSPRLCHPEVWYGPPTHTVLHYSIVWGIHTDQR